MTLEKLIRRIYDIFCFCIFFFTKKNKK